MGPRALFSFSQEAFGEGQVQVYKGGRYGQPTFPLPPWISPP
jgi:hypothetical protein